MSQKLETRGPKKRVIMMRMTTIEPPRSRRAGSRARQKTTTYASGESAEAAALPPG